MSGLSERDVERLVEALRYDRCEYGCAITYTEETVKYDLAPVVAAIRDEAKAEALAPIRVLADSIHGESDYGQAHNPGCEGEPDCLACIEAGLRALLDGGDQ